MRLYILIIKLIHLTQLKLRYIPKSKLFVVVIHSLLVFITAFQKFEPASIFIGTSNSGWLILLLIAGFSYQSTMLTKQRVLKNTRSIYSNLSVVGMMVKARENQLHLFITLILIKAFIYVFFTTATEDEPHRYFYIILISLVSLAFFRDKIFEYRVKNGIYGDNEGEARQIIRFILKNSNNIDSGGKGGGKRIIRKEDLTQMEGALYGSQTLESHYSLLR